MSITANPEWQQLALYALGAAVMLFLLFRIPFVGTLLRALFSLALLAFGIFLLLQHAPFDPNLSRLTEQIGLDRQQVTGDEVRITMSPDGHFWARADINGVERQLLVDSGATVTVLSVETAELASVDRGTGLMPIVLQTGNGMVQAETGTIERLDLGGIEARDLQVAVAPGMGGFDVLGMNFLSRLASWRVEGDTLILVAGDADEGA